MSYEPSWPHGWPHAWGDGSVPASTSSVWADFITRIGPPWLRRTWARRILSALVSPLDVLDTSLVAAVKARFPVFSMPSALPLLGRERRIRRGPAEPAHTYAPRLIRWLDDHRGRGGAYALLRQLRAFWTGTHDGTFAVVSHRGVRHESVGDTITRDVISWGADGTGNWSQVWVMLHVDADPRPLGTVGEATYLAVPVDWNAAHVRWVHVVVLWGHGRLWDYPPPTGDWDDWESGLTWDEWDAEMPFVITHEET